ncbi:MAG TPA: hypothetical protein VGI67_06805 [Thermoleophilaceae bacterium]|jgi:hypothetical protein
MKAQSRIRRALLALAVTGCLCALALPALAGARPIIYQPVSTLTAAPPASEHPHGRPAAYADAALPLPGTHGLGIATDTQSNGYSVSTAYALPSGFGSDVQTGGPVSTQTPSTVVVREIHNTPSNDDHTLAIVLASAALAIALCGTAYATFRTTRIQRRVLGSNS